MLWALSLKVLTKDKKKSKVNIEHDRRCPLKDNRANGKIWIKRIIGYRSK